MVTLEVLPEDAEIVSLATREGMIDLALRAGSDNKPVETRGATPVMFSAFAPEITIDPTTGQPVLGNAPAESGKETTGPGVVASRKIELRALTQRSRRPPKSIETYNAR